jgi:hypothetical protein
MGLSISPVKAAIACAEAERQGWARLSKARALGYLKAGETMQQVIAGSRIADDATLLSKVVCGKCIVRFAQEVVYRRRLPVEEEEIGPAIGVADLGLAVKTLPDGSLFLDIFKRDKNADWVIGAATRAARVRYEPFLQYQSISQIRGWISGRLVDEQRKNALSLSLSTLPRGRPQG